MNENEVLVTEQVTENVEQTTEQTPKMFTQDEVNDIVGRSKARERAKIEKQYKREYGELVDVLRAGTGKETVEDMTSTFRDFYTKKGLKIPEKPTYSAKDIEVLARADADEIIRGGFDDVIEEADRLKEIGAANMTAREKAVFVALTNHIQATETGRELSKLGVTEEVYASKDFKDFMGKFNPQTPIAEIYEIYSNRQPKKEIKTMGSMKNTPAADSGVKEYYSPEEARKFTKADFDKNPALFAAVEKSMLKWRK